VKKNAKQVVFYDEKACALLSNITSVEDNSKMADVTVT
jgi:hypothetical protein